MLKNTSSQWFGTCREANLEKYSDTMPLPVLLTAAPQMKAVGAPIVSATEQLGLMGVG
jgi:hypothetical protein